MINDEPKEHETPLPAEHVEQAVGTRINTEPPSVFEQNHTPFVEAAVDKAINILNEDQISRLIQTSENVWQNICRLGKDQASVDAGVEREGVETVAAWFDELNQLATEVQSNLRQAAEELLVANNRLKEVPKPEDRGDRALVADWFTVCKTAMHYYSY